VSVRLLLREYEQAGHADWAARLCSEAQALMAVILGKDSAGG
jgi:hypothetical protein